MPIAHEFNPEIVLISAGFDAGKGDPIGECYLSPDCFAHLTHSLKALANGKVVLVLEVTNALFRAVTTYQR